jgi:hypothetical protein
MDADIMTSLEDNKIPFSPQAPPILSNRDELDLVNIVGFIWKCKSWIAAGSLTGLVMAGALVAFGKLNSSVDSDSISWTAKISFPQDLPQSEFDLASLTLSKFIESPAGKATLLQSFAEAGGGLNRLPCLVGDNCFLQSIRESGSSVAIFVNQPKALNEDEVRKHLLLVLNKLVRKFNAEYANPQFMRKQELLAIQNRLAQLRNRGIELFAQFSALSRDTKNSVLSAVSRQLMEEKSSDTFAFLLGSVPDSDPQKAVLITEYNRLQAASEILVQKMKNLSTAFGVNSIVAIPELTEIQSVQVLPSQGSGFGRAVATKPLSIIVLGFMVGTVLGTLVALCLSFWSRNRDRIRRIAGKPYF